MGEGFQFSSPYKWRCSKLFYRLFVYCSWLLIARDNSTGFTIQWGVCNVAHTSNTKVWFPRQFGSCHMAVATFRKANAHTGAEGTITINIESGSSMRIYQWDAGSCSGIYWTAVGFSQSRDNSTGFTIQWGICTPKSWFNYPRAFSSSRPPVGVWLSNGKSARGIEANSYNNSGANLIESAGGACANANSIAYIVVGFS